MDGCEDTAAAISTSFLFIRFYDEKKTDREREREEGRKREREGNKEREIERKREKRERGGGWGSVYVCERKRNVAHHYRRRRLTILIM